MMEIRLANINDKDKVIGFYKFVSSDPNNKARWTYGLYPTDDDLIEDINNNELYILLDDGEIASAAVIRMFEDDLYKEINWNKHNPAVIHILATSPLKQRCGYAKKLLTYLINIAKQNNKDSIHLDIVYDNDYAAKLYRSLGFIKIVDQELYYPDTGLILSTLFELII